MRILLGAGRVAFWSVLTAAAGVAAQQPAPPPPLVELCSLAQGTQTCVEFDGEKTVLVGGPSSIRVCAVPGPGNPLQAKTTFEPRGCVTALVPLPAPGALLVRAGSNEWSVWDPATGKVLKHALEDAAVLLPVERAAGRRDPTADAAAPWTVLPDPSGVRLWDARFLREKRSRIMELRVDRWGDDAISGAKVATLAGGDLLTGDADGFVLRVPLSGIFSSAWDAATPGNTPPARAPRSPRNVGAFHPHEGSLTGILALAGPSRGTWVTAGLDGKVKGWTDIPALDPHPKNPRPTRVEPAWTLPGHFADASPDGRRLAVAERDGIRVYEMPSRNVVAWTPSARRGRPLRLRWSPDNALLAAVYCACAECDRAEVLVAYRKPFEEHGGPLVLWKAK